MRIRDIDLNHFNITLEKKRVGFSSGILSVKTIPHFAKTYKDSRNEKMRLNYSFATELSFENTEVNDKINLDDLTQKQSNSIKQSIAARFNSIIKARNKYWPITPVKITESDTSTTEKPDDDFDFSELDEIDKTQQIPILTDFAIKVEATKPKAENNDLDKLDFDFDELDIAEEITTKQTNDLNSSDDFDFDFDFEDDVLSKDFNKEETLVNAKHLNDEFDFDELIDEVTSDFEEILEKDTPVKSRSIDEMLTSLVDSRQKLNVSYQTIGKLLDEIKRVEENHKSIEATVDDLERELFKELQKKHQ